MQEKSKKSDDLAWNEPPASILIKEDIKLTDHRNTQRLSAILLFIQNVNNDISKHSLCEILILLHIFNV